LEETFSCLSRLPQTGTTTDEGWSFKFYPPPPPHKKKKNQHRYTTKKKKYEHDFLSFADPAWFVLFDWNAGGSIITLGLFVLFLDSNLLVLIIKSQAVRSFRNQIQSLLEKRCSLKFKILIYEFLIKFKSLNMVEVFERKKFYSNLCYAFHEQIWSCLQNVCTCLSMIYIKEANINSTTSRIEEFMLESLTYKLVRMMTELVVVLCITLIFLVI
jgi:hypothetical protein